MTVNYTKLWKLLIDKNMSKKELRIAAGITTNAMVKLSNNKNVSTEILCKICEILKCKLEDIAEVE